MFFHERTLTVDRFEHGIVTPENAHHAAQGIREILEGTQFMFIHSERDSWEPFALTLHGPENLSEPDSIRVTQFGIEIWFVDSIGNQAWVIPMDGKSYLRLYRESGQATVKFIDLYSMPIAYHCAVVISR